MSRYHTHTHTHTHTYTREEEAEEEEVGGKEERKKGATKVSHGYEVSVKKKATKKKLERLLVAEAH